MIQHPVHKSYYIDNNGKFFHQLGPLTVELKPSTDGSITVTDGDKRKLLSQADFLRDIRQHQMRTNK